MLGSSHRRRHSAEHLSVNPLFAQGSVLAPIPSKRLPAGEMSSAAAYQIIHDELMLDGNARQNLATFVTTWMEPEDRMPAQEHDRQGRVPADGRDRAPLRLDDGRPVERARSQQGSRLLDRRVVGGMHARRPGHEEALAAGPTRSRQAR